MYEFDWTHPIRPCYQDRRTKAQKIKDDFSMIFCSSNVRPLSNWISIWLQLFKHILS